MNEFNVKLKDTNIGAIPQVKMKFDELVFLKLSTITSVSYGK